MPTLTVIIGSTRPGRAGLPIAQWFIERARADGDFEVTVADLAEIDLPLLDEPSHPRLRQYIHQHTQDWSAIVEASDAFVLVTSEYNHSYPAPLKNAIDYLHHEWKDKPAGFVSYGGVAAGTRSVAHLKPILSVLKMVPTTEQVNIPFYSQFMDEEGRFVPNEVTEQAADAMLAELLRLHTALSELRAVPAAR